jgi:RNA polymerase sigma-70 factor (ECF subfamily)
LLTAIGNGDRHALERAYLAHKDDLLTVAVYVLGKRELAEDVLHDVFVTLARRAASIVLRGSLRSYLLASCANRARDLLRHRAREPRGAVLARPPSGPAPVQAVEIEEERLQLVAAVARLPVEQREVLTLHIHGQLTFAEVAEQLNIPANTAQSRYRYALAALRRELAPD